MVFLTYIVYVLLFAFPGMIPSGYYADDFLGFLRHTVYEVCSLVQVADARTSASRPSVFKRTQFVSDHAGYLNELFSGLALIRRGVARQLREHYANAYRFTFA